MKISEIFFLIAILFFSSCKKYPYFNHAEINCLHLDRKFLIKNVVAEDVREAIKKALLRKQQGNFADNYTAIKLPDGRSLMIKKLLPEDAAKCGVREVPPSFERYYIQG